METDRPSGLAALLAIIARGHHDVEISWSQQDVVELGDGPWYCEARFTGTLGRDALLELVEWATDCPVTDGASFDVFRAGPRAGVRA